MGGWFDSPQEKEAFKRGLYSFLAGALGALLPFFLDGTPDLDWKLAVKAAIGAGLTSLGKRVWEGTKDATRAAKVEGGDLDALSTADVGGAATKALLEMPPPPLPSIRQVP